MGNVANCVNESIHFLCVYLIVQCKTIKCFPNNKPWVTSDIKVAINNKNYAFKN